jgi:hypothetical protein
VSDPESKLESSNGDARRTTHSPALRAVSQTAKQIRRVDQQLIERAREQPLLAVAFAMAAGYIIGRAFSRWG